MDTSVDNASMKPFARLRTRAGHLALLFIDLWWAVEISLSDTHRNIPYLKFIDGWGGNEIIFDVALWSIALVTGWAFYRPASRRLMMVMAFANLAWWTFVGIQFWVVTQTKLVSGLCFGLAVAMLARIAEVSGEGQHHD